MKLLVVIFLSYLDYWWLIFHFGGLFNPTKNEKLKSSSIRYKDISYMGGHGESSFHHHHHTSHEYEYIWYMGGEFHFPHTKDFLY